MGFDKDSTRAMIRPVTFTFFLEGNMTLSELNLAIIKWAEDRQILKHSTAYAQAFKTAEEVMELVEATTLYREHPDHSGSEYDIMDAVGDIYVTLVVGVSCCSEDRRDLQPTRSSGEFIGVEYLSAALVNLAKSAPRRDEPAGLRYFDMVDWFLQILDQYAKRYGTTLEACVNQAYDQIKDRKGHLTADGIFVKEEV